MKPASRLLGFAAFGLSMLAAADMAGAQQGMRRVDLELVLAVDVSRSMDFDEHTLQRNGYVEAFRHRDVINALLSGPEGKIAVTYMEWAGEYPPNQLIPWTIIDSAAASHAFADRLAEEEVYGERRTSISTALYEAERLIRENDIAAHRRVIDVSGDGANNAGPPVEEARDFVLKADITINGLPILLNPSGYGGFGGGGGLGQGYDIPHLDRYYKHCVIGGDGAFIAPVFNLNQLSATIRKKLVLEIANLDPGAYEPPGTAAVQFAEAGPPEPPSTLGGEPKIVLAQLKLPTEKTDCMSGERQRMMRDGGGFGGGINNN
jgi:hypothetical protein